MRFAILYFTFMSIAAHAENLYIGLTARGSRIEAAASGDSGPTVVLIEGLNGRTESAKLALRKNLRKKKIRLLTIALANPDGTKLVFPPAGVAYRDNPESHALWRWIAMQAPDLVLIPGEDFGLAEALSKNPPDVGAIRVAKELPKNIPPSPAHREIERRVARSPRELADELGPYYGHDFTDPVYIQAVALIAQLRLGNLAEMERLASPYADGSKNSLARPTSPTLAGHLIFAELAERTHDLRYVDLVRKVADLGFTPDGQMKESMPLHDEMSDSVFMACPILVKAGKLTGEQKYFDMAARHYRFMANLDLRSDGIYRHSPLSDAAWGRGNAFPALGLALTLADFPKNHPDYPALLLAYQKHLTALSRVQDAEGMWHEIVDEPASYAEFSATAMIATAMHIGIRNGWLDAHSYEPRVDRAWQAINKRVGGSGRLLDVCESTGKQKNAADYLRRAAIWGPDPRGGAMALLFSTEMAGLK